jgi:3-hydroxyacyl-[acyl-carrier-protein] dehydratase
MPSQSLIDFDALDLSRVISGPEVLDKYRGQRGRLSMIDGILHEDPTAQLVVGYKDIRADDWWAKDHFPDRPLFPGALMIESAAQLATYDYLKNRGQVGEGRVVGFGGVDDARFRGKVTPPSRMIFAVYLRRARTQMFLYETQGFVEGALVFEAKVRGVVV